MLELKDISVGYTGRYLIPKVTLSFAPGKIYGILGKNGSGKSGLLKKCAGQEQSGNGAILLDGRQLTDISVQELCKRIGYLPQDRAVTVMPARHLVAKSLSRNCRRTFNVSLEEKRKVYNCLSAMRAAGLAQLPMNRMSRGERRRIYMAALLAQDPDIYVLDEPFSDLDLEYRELLRQTLLRLKAEGKTVIMALQDLELAMACCDELVVIDIGREVYTGTPERIRQEKLLEKAFRLPD